MSADSDLLQAYLDDLVGTPHVPSAPAPPPVVVPERSVEPKFKARPVTTIPHDRPPALEALKRQQLQALLSRPAVETPTKATAETAVVSPPSPTAATQVQPPVQQASPPDPQSDVQIERDVTRVEEVARKLQMSPPAALQWRDNGRPAWAQQKFDVLLFRVAGLTLAVPLVALGHIHPLTDDLTPIFGQADWFMGLQPTSAGQIRTVNTALFVMPERYDPAFVKSARYVVSIDGLDWGLAVDAVQQPTRLQPEDVTWRTQRSKRPWLAGTVKAAMCALLDIPQMGQLLENHDRKRRAGAPSSRPS